MDKITIERETLERAIADYDSAAGNDGTLLSWNRARDNLLALLRAALAAQPAPAAVPLTDEQIDALMSAANLSIVPEGWTVDAWVVHRVARAVERAHGIAAARDKP